MKLLSATDLAIALAVKNGTLKVTERVGRFGQFWAIADDVGLIEVQMTETAMRERIDSITALAA